jgi:hypothetical protein
LQGPMAELDNAAELVSGLQRRVEELMGKATAEKEKMSEAIVTWIGK